MTVGDSGWPLYCLSSPLLPILWHLLQLNVATATPLFYVVHLLGLPWWCKPSTLPSKIVNAKFPALPLVTCPKYCSFIRATFPINSLSRPISSNIDIFCLPCEYCEIGTWTLMVLQYRSYFFHLVASHTQCLTACFLWLLNAAVERVWWLLSVGRWRCQESVNMQWSTCVLPCCCCVYCTRPAFTWQFMPSFVVSLESLFTISHSAFSCGSLSSTSQYFITAWCWYNILSHSSILSEWLNVRDLRIVFFVRIESRIELAVYHASRNTA